MLACPMSTTLGLWAEFVLGVWFVVGAAPAEAPNGHVIIAVALDSITVQGLHLGQGQGAKHGHAHFVLCCWDELLSWSLQRWWVAWLW